MIGVVVVAGLLAGCTGTGDGDAGPTSSATTSAATPTTSAPTPTPTALTAPARAKGEVARVVFQEEGPDGIPTSEGTVFAVLKPGVMYRVETVCVPMAAGAMLGYTVESAATDADPDAGPLISSEFACDGTPSADEWTAYDDIPVQISFTRTDGVFSAYARVVPVD